MGDGRVVRDGRDGGRDGGDGDGWGQDLVGGVLWEVRALRGSYLYDMHLGFGGWAA